MNCILASRQFITKRMTWICNYYSEEKPYNYMLRFLTDKLFSLLFLKLYQIWKKHYQFPLIMTQNCNWSTDNVLPDCRLDRSKTSLASHVYFAKCTMFNFRAHEFNVKS